MAIIIDGKVFSESLRKKIQKVTASLKDQQGIKPGLAAVLVGADPASEVYVRNKGRRADKAGFNSFQYKLPVTTTEDELLSLIGQLNQDSQVHGILVQLPLPDHIAESKVINAIHPEKDVDGFHYENVGRLVTGEEGYVPCTPLGCLMLLKHHLGNLSGLNAVVVGRSNIVGKPMAALLLKESCTVTIAHSRTRNLADVCRRADILVAAVGRPEMIPGEWIKPGATIIDVGINRVYDAQGNKRLVGDVDFESALKVAGAITPVPGGVGPMTIACLLHNTYVAACRLNDVPVARIE